MAKIDLTIRSSVQLEHLCETRPNYVIFDFNLLYFHRRLRSNDQELETSSRPDRGTACRGERGQQAETEAEESGCEGFEEAARKM